MLRSMSRLQSSLSLSPSSLFAPIHLRPEKFPQQQSVIAVDHAARTQVHPTDASAFLAAKKGVKFGKVNGKTGIAAGIEKGRESMRHLD